MPRRFYPIFTDEAIVTAPVTLQTYQYIPQWNDVAYTGAGSTAYRIVAEAPFDGRIDGVFFVPDNSITAISTKRWRIHLVNRGQFGTDTPVEITQAWKTSTNLTACAWVELPVSTTKSNVEVTQGDIIAWRAVQEIDAGADNTNPSARPTGMLIVWWAALTTGS
jgi:hypothetical protein